MKTLIIPNFQIESSGLFFGYSSVMSLIFADHLFFIKNIIKFGNLSNEQIISPTFGDKDFVSRRGIF